jgi:hypothetical protein
LTGARIARSAAALLLVSLCAGSGTARAQSEADRAEAIALELDGTLETERFAVFWRTEEASAAQVSELLQTLDDYYAGISAAVGPERTPQRRIVILLDGHGQAPDGTWRFPRVDRTGRVYLYRYSPEFPAYAVEAAHELVHAFRRAAGFWHSGFWEEGFAEAIAMNVDPGDVGFPRYGYPLTVAAGHLLAWDQYVPLADIRSRHRQMGRQCQLQAYLERAAFFDYLVRLEGIHALVELGYEPDNPGDEDYARVYGQSFEELVSDWEIQLLTEYRATPDAEETARRYRAEPAIASRTFCEVD